MKNKSVRESMKRFRERLWTTLKETSIPFTVLSVTVTFYTFEKGEQFKRLSEWLGVLIVVIGLASFVWVCGLSVFLLTLLADGVLATLESLSGTYRRTVHLLRTNVHRTRCTLERARKFLLTPRWTYSETFRLLGTMVLLILLVPLTTTLIYHTPGGIRNRPPGTAIGPVEPPRVLLPSVRNSKPGEQVVLPVRLTNLGTESWKGRFLCPIDTVRLIDSPDCIPIPDAQPGETSDVSLRLRAPLTAGLYAASFKIVENGTFVYPDVNPIRAFIRVS